MFKSQKEEKTFADRFNKGRKKGKQANQDEVIKSIKRKFDSLYQNNTAIKIGDYLLFAMSTQNDEEMTVYEFPKNKSWKLSNNVGEQIFEEQGNEEWKPLYYPIYRTYSSDVGLLRYHSKQERKLSSLVFCSTNLFSMKVNAQSIKILR